MRRERTYRTGHLMSLPGNCVIWSIQHAVVDWEKPIEIKCNSNPDKYSLRLLSPFSGEKISWISDFGQLVIVQYRVMGLKKFPFNALNSHSSCDYLRRNSVYWIFEESLQRCNNFSKGLQLGHSLIRQRPMYDHQPSLHGDRKLLIMLTHILWWFLKIILCVNCIIRSAAWQNHHEALCTQAPEHDIFLYIIN